MIRAIRSIGVPFLFATLAAAGGAGCATASGGLSRSQDLHATARVAGDAAHVLVRGPALLMHVDIQGRDDLALFAVARKTGTDADCAGPQTGERRHLRPGVPNLVNLAVAADQAICIGAEPSDRTASVVWHARQLDGRPAPSPGQSIALDRFDR